MIPYHNRVNLPPEPNSHVGGAGPNSVFGMLDVLRALGKETRLLSERPTLRKSVYNAWCAYYNVYLQRSNLQAIRFCCTHVSRLANLRCTVVHNNVTRAVEAPRFGDGHDLAPLTVNIMYRDLPTCRNLAFFLSNIPTTVCLFR